MKHLALLVLLACQPDTVPGAHGPIAVRDTLFPNWADTTSADLTLGEWYPARREIMLDRRLTREIRPLVLGHERCHAALTDAGIALPEVVEERICDVMAAGFRER